MPRNLEQVLAKLPAKRRAKVQQRAAELATLKDLCHDAGGTCDRPRRGTGHDLAPVSQLATFDYAFAVSAQSQWHTFADFAAWARRKGDDASFGAPGAGSLPHFLGLHLARVARFRTAFIPYASTGKLESDLVG